METYPVKAVARMTGLTPETLRAWERRYGAVTPTRDAGGRRTYSPEDVERLRGFKRLVDAGHAISRVVAMEHGDRRRLLAELDAAPPAADDLATVREALLQAVAAYDTAELDRRLGLAMATLDADSVVREVLGPLLEAVGEGWQRGEMDIAQERLVSSAIRARILSTLRNAPELRPALMLATPPGERHELGLLLFAYRAASRLIPLRYLGPDLPMAEIGRLAEHFRPRVIALSLVCPPETGWLDELETLAAKTGEIWLGGRGARALEGPLPPGCRLIRNGDESRQALEALSPLA